MAPRRSQAVLALVLAASAVLARGGLVKEVRVESPEIRVATFPIPLNVTRVDYDVHPQIVGGQDAKLGQFPHQVSMQITLPNEFWVLAKPQHLCGGTLIATNWVLTAAHCVYGVPNKSTKVEVVLGIDNLAVKAAGSQRIAVSKMLAHAKYDHYSNSGVGPYDIALLKLVRHAKLSETVKLAVLPKADSSPEGDTATLSGWGSTSQDGRNPVYPNQLQTADFPVVSYDACITFVNDIDPGTTALIADTNLCVGPLDKTGLSSCSGDSGGPLIQTDKQGAVIVIGVVSWGLFNCGAQPFPSIFTRVSAYVDWIQKVQATY